MGKQNGSAEPTFSSLGLNRDSLRAIQALGFKTPSKIQAAFIPIALTGSDCSGQARTGTGKTAAFAIPLLERLDLSQKRVMGLVLAPTRELSEQVAGEIDRISNGRARTAVLVGGRPIPSQIRALRNGAQIVIGTPGRILDLIQRDVLSLSDIEIAVLDEADRMLDEGFRPDIERILKRCPVERQTLLLSATMPPEVEQLAKRYMRDPRRIDMSSDALVASEMIEQFVITVDADRKIELLSRVLYRERPWQVIVFCRTKRGADSLYAKLRSRLGNIALIHGDLPQPKRDRVLAGLRSGKVRMLIATDVVGRGIDISGVSHIVNFDIPEYCDDYVHRIGRTGRLSSDQKGRAITFVTRDQGDQLTRIENRVNTLLPQYEVEDFEASRPRERKVFAVKETVERSRSAVYTHS